MALRRRCAAAPGTNAHAKAMTINKTMLLLLVEE
jgi:hypothetical protein